GRQRLRYLRVRRVTHSQEDDISLDGLRQRLRNDLGADSGRVGGKALWVASGCNRYLDAATGKSLGKSLADVAEANNRITHILSFLVAAPCGFQLSAGVAGRAPYVRSAPGRRRRQA